MIDFDSPEAIEGFIKKNKAEDISPLLVDLLDISVYCGHETTVSKFVGESFFSGMTKTKIKIDKRPVDEDIEICESWLDVASESLKFG